MVCLSHSGLFGCLNFPLTQVWYWAVIMGFGQGGMMSLALVLIALRSPSATIAMTMSGMAQSVGYGLASIGPLVIGLPHDRAGHWEHTSFPIMALGFGALIFGWPAGNDSQIGEPPLLIPTSELSPQTTQGA
jgi:CP family cyanate transporter-like MFS transporter